MGWMMGALALRFVPSIPLFLFSLFWERESQAKNKIEPTHIQ